MRGRIEEPVVGDPASPAAVVEAVAPSELRTFKCSG
jgi:hypothetical protein